MRIPSFVRLPNHKKFNMPLRHYNPIKEELEGRVEESTREFLNHKKVNGSKVGISFKRKPNRIPSTGFIQLFIIIVLVILIIGWLQYGNDIFYFGFIVVPAYLYFRFKRQPKKKLLR